MHNHENGKIFRSGRISPSLNKEQELAVKNIVQGTSKPYPFILLGPPGMCPICNILNHLNLLIELT
jgi:hypothetical protein